MFQGIQISSREIKKIEEQGYAEVKYKEAAWLKNQIKILSLRK